MLSAKALMDVWSSYSAFPIITRALLARDRGTPKQNPRGILQQVCSLREEVLCSCSGPLFANAAQAGMGLPREGLDGGVLQLMGGQRSAPAAKRKASVEAASAPE